MKLPVYDTVNKSRLLGYLNHEGSLLGVTLKVSLPYQDGWHWPLVLATAYAPPPLRQHYTSIVFDIDVQQESNAEQIDDATRKITTIERKVLLTKATLETLMKLDRFVLPGETAEQSAFRHHSSGRKYSHRDFY
jgi:hypothetical protein